MYCSTCMPTTQNWEPHFGHTSQKVPHIIQTFSGQDVKYGWFLGNVSFIIYFLKDEHSWPLGIDWKDSCIYCLPQLIKKNYNNDILCDTFQLQGFSLDNRELPRELWPAQASPSGLQQQVRAMWCLLELTNQPQGLMDDRVEKEYHWSRCRYALTAADPSADWQAVCARLSHK